MPSFLMLRMVVRAGALATDRLIAVTGAIWTRMHCVKGGFDKVADQLRSIDAQIALASMPRIGIVAGPPQFSRDCLQTARDFSVVSAGAPDVYCEICAGSGLIGRFVILRLHSV
jgi:hypothetical protein